MRRLSTSMKRATIVFVMPDKGRVSFQEGKGIKSQKLRGAINGAYARFWQLYTRKEASEKTKR